jgi:hypothetical protein
VKVFCRSEYGTEVGSIELKRGVGRALRHTGLIALHPLSGRIDPTKIIIELQGIRDAHGVLIPDYCRDENIHAKTPQGFRGTVSNYSASAPQSTFTLTLAPDLAFSTITNSTAITVYQQNGHTCVA